MASRLKKACGCNAGILSNFYFPTDDAGVYTKEVYLQINTVDEGIVEEIKANLNTLKVENREVKIRTFKVYAYQRGKRSHSRSTNCTVASRQSTQSYSTVHDAPSPRRFDTTRRSRSRSQSTVLKRSRNRSQSRSRSPIERSKTYWSKTRRTYPKESSRKDYSRFSTSSRHKYSQDHGSHRSHGSHYQD